MTTDAQERIIKQVSDRYASTSAEPIGAPDVHGHRDYRVTARRHSNPDVIFQRKFIVTPRGAIRDDTGEREYDYT